MLGPWFTTPDELPGAIALRVSAGGATSAAAAHDFDWEAARRFAGENTRLRVGDLLLAPATVVADVRSGPVTVDAGGLGRLELTVETG